MNKERNSHMKRVCLLVGMAALATMDGMAEFRTNDINGVTMVL